MGSPERRPAHVILIVANETSELPVFKSYVKCLPLVIHIKKSNGKYQVQSQMEVFRSLLPKNEDILHPTHGVVFKSIEMQGYYNPAPFDFSVEMTIDTGEFTNSSSSPSLYGFKFSKNYARTSSPSSKNDENEDGNASSKKGKKRSKLNDVNTTDQQHQQTKIKCTFDFRKNTLSNVDEGTESMFKWKHDQYKIMTKFANFNFSTLAASSIRGTTLNENGMPYQQSPPPPPSSSLQTKQLDEASPSTLTNDETPNLPPTTTTNKHQQTSKGGSEELHLINSPMHHLVLSLVNTDLLRCKADEREEKLSYYTPMLKYGANNEIIDTDTELRSYFNQRHQQQQQQQNNGGNGDNQQKQFKGEYVFINGSLCEEIRSQVRRMSDSIRFAKLSDEGMRSQLFMQQNSSIEEGCDYYIPFYLKIEYMHVPFDNIVEPK